VIRVLVVDDSAFVRQAMVRMLASAPDIEVVTAATRTTTPVTPTKKRSASTAHDGSDPEKETTIPTSGARFQTVPRALATPSGPRSRPVASDRTRRSSMSRSTSSNGSRHRSACSPA